MAGTLDPLSYTNYRKLIENFYILKNKETAGRFSYRAFSKKAGFASPNYINLIVQNKKNLSQSGIHQVAKAMKLKSRERNFFEALVFFNQAKSASEKEHYFERILSFKEFLEAQQISKDQYEYFSKWYYVAVRELFLLPTFQNNLSWISKTLIPNISMAQAKEAVLLLQRLKLVKQNKSGRWIVSDPHIKTEPEVVSVYATNFHREMITRGLEALDHKANTRDISSITMAVDEEQFKQIKKKIIKFRDDIQKYLNETNTKADRVCQLNYQLFHLTKDKRSMK